MSGAGGSLSLKESAFVLDFPMCLDCQRSAAERENDKTHCKISLLNYLKDCTVVEGIQID